MKIFVNNVYYTERCIEWVELVVHDENALKNKYVTMSMDECIDYCEECKEKGFFVEPLLTGTFSFPKRVRTTYIKEKHDVSPGVVEEQSIPSVYSLYWDLAKCNAVYVDSEDCYEDGFKGYVSSFTGLRVSSSTMSILLSYYDHSNQSWKSKNLIRDNKEKIEQYEFYCAIPKEYCSQFYKYGLNKIKDIVLNNKEFILFKYVKNLSIYRVVQSQQFTESLIVHYALLETKYKALTQITSYGIKDVQEHLKLETPAIPVSSSNLRSTNIFNDKVGVFFKGNFPKTSQSVVVNLYNLAFKLYEVLESSNQEYTNNLQTCKGILAQQSLPYYNDFALMFLMETFKEGNGKTLSTLDVLQDTYYKSKLLYLEVSMYLYSLRLNTYANPSVLDYRDRESLFNITSFEGSVEVEVWSWT